MTAPSLPQSTETWIARCDRPGHENHLASWSSTVDPQQLGNTQLTHTVTCPEETP